MSHPETMPLLRLVPSDSILFHERPERRRTERITRRIREDRQLRNPPIVADLKDGKYLLLDGANRVSGMKALHYSHTPVQVVDYGEPSIELKGWHHLLIQGRALNLLDSLRAMDQLAVRQVEAVEIERLLEARRLLAIFVDEGAAAWGLYPAQDSPKVDSFARIAALERIVATYEGQSDLERIKLAEFSNLPEVIRSVEHQLCLFPALYKEELLELARAQVMIPTGITRHLIPGRALGLNLALDFLTALPSDEAKQAHFQDYLDRLEIEGRIRFYEESVFIMNE
ncbi:MAG: hypothetical protein O7A67_07535 [SAR324 cluster bacterium]|nr:hypothetical protein [SAR324 cluster bacterium]